MEVSRYVIGTKEMGKIRLKRRSSLGEGKEEGWHNIAGVEMKGEFDLEEERCNLAGRMKGESDSYLIFDFHFFHEFPDN